LTELMNMRRLLLTLPIAVLVAAVLAGQAGSVSQTVESYQIRNQKFGQLLRPEDASSADGTRLVLYPAQMWKCMTWKRLPAGSSTFALQNHLTSKTFSAQGDGQQVSVLQIPVAANASARQTWRFVKLQDSTYQIIDTGSGKALTAVASGSSTIVVVAPWQDKPEQHWELILTDPRKLTM